MSCQSIDPSRLIRHLEGEDRRLARRRLRRHLTTCADCRRELELLRRLRREAGSLLEPVPQPVRSAEDFARSIMAASGMAPRRRRRWLLAPVGAGLAAALALCLLLLPLGPREERLEERLAAGLLDRPEMMALWEEEAGPEGWVGREAELLAELGQDGPLTAVPSLPEELYPDEGSLLEELVEDEVAEFFERLEEA